MMIKLEKKQKQIDKIIYFFIAIFFAIILLSFNYKECSLAVLGTFFIIGGFSFYKIVSAKKNISLKRIFYIFNFIFMFFAPLQQYLSGTVLWTGNGWTLRYTDNDYLKANLVLIIFIVMFEIAYKIRLGNKKNIKKQVSSFSVKSNSASLFFLNVISIGCCLLLLITGNIGGRVGLAFENSNISSQILNIIRFFPVACFFIAIMQSSRDTKDISLNVLLYAVEIIIIYFPFNGSLSRFLLFGVYLGIITLFFSHSKIKSIYFLLFVVGFFFVFSAFNFFKTNGLENLGDFSLKTVDFNTVDYDAYQMLMATIHYVEEVGATNGKNILTAIFCFIPRSIWTGKMDCGMFFCFRLVWYCFWRAFNGLVIQMDGFV